MRERYANQAVLGIVLICQVSICLAVEAHDPNDSSKYLNAVREFADNVLKYGRDTYGPKHTPLFVDGLNIHTHEPVKWIAPNGDRWILSNLASQQNLFRTLDGLTRITGDPKYKQAAMDAIKYAFENLRSPNGLLYWGECALYDAQADKVAYGIQRIHSFKAVYPYYELMWEVDPYITKDFIESLWAVHVLDWSNLDMNRYGPFDRLSVAKGWNHEYEGGPVFFVGKGIPFNSTGTDLCYAAAILSKLSRQKDSLIWAKRLAGRYMETRNSLTGIVATVYTKRSDQHPLVEDFKGHVVHRGTVFYNKGIDDLSSIRLGLHNYIYSPGLIGGWLTTFAICNSLVSEILGDDGKEFKQWVLEDLIARANTAYRKEDNSWVPMLTDGTILEGYVLNRDVHGFDKKGSVIKAWHADLTDFWAYALAYRLTGNELMWEMAGNIAKGNHLGDIGTSPKATTSLNLATDCVNAHALLGFLCLYDRSQAEPLLGMARRIGDNILAQRFHSEFFVPSYKHTYAKLDAVESLTLLHLYVAINKGGIKPPTIWPSNARFVGPYRAKEEAYDISLIYTLTDVIEPPVSLSEAAAMGNAELVKSLIAEGADVNEAETGMSYTPLYCAVRGRFTNIVQILLSNCADVNKACDWRLENPLHTAVNLRDSRQIIELLLVRGANINAKNSFGDTPLQYAAYADNKEIIELLLQKGATIANLHIASYMGDLEKAEAFINTGVDINAIDGHGYAPLHYAVQNKQKEIIELLTAKGAEVSVGRWGGKNGQTPLDIAVSRGYKDIAELLLSKGAEGSIHTAASIGDVEKVKAFLEDGTDVNVKDARDMNALHYAAREGHKEVVELLLENGADVNAGAWYKRTAAEFAMRQNHTEIVELLIYKGADISPLHLAIYMKDETRVRSLIETGADVNKKTQYGTSPLLTAVGAGLNNIVELLIDKGANVNVRDNWDWTPLHGAVSKSKDMVELLIANGANVNAKDGNARIPLWYAEKGGHTEIAEILRKHGAKE